jgi:tRNA(Ile)-lysidine synthase
MNTNIQLMTLNERVLEYIRKNKLIESGQKILVAVSGGQDSVCLLHTLYKLQTELGITLYAAHLNHQLRSQESERDAKFVSELSFSLGIPAIIEKGDVTGYQVQHKLSMEEAAREVRYSFLARVTRKVGADRVAVGHTRSDQAETILLHFIRGTGTTGLRGLQPLHTASFSGQSLTIIRPLLEITRQETEDYCAQAQLIPCQDSSNLSLSLLRNRVRQELLPLLQNYNPGIIDALLRTARIAAEDLDFLEQEASRIWPEIVEKQEKVVILRKKPFKKLAPALQRHLLRRAIDELLGRLKDIETRHIEEILEMLNKPAGRRIDLPEGLVFSNEYDRYLLGFGVSGLSPFPELKGEYDINMPGETLLPGWRIEARILPHEDLRDIKEFDNFTACLDNRLVGDKIKIRARQNGDWFQPLGMDKPKKVGEFMLDARIPRDWRQNIPVILSGHQVVWVVGWRIDDRVKVTEKTREVLCLRVGRTDEQRGKSRSNRRKSQT